MSRIVALALATSLLPGCMVASHTLSREWKTYVKELDRRVEDRPARPSTVSRVRVTWKDRFGLIAVEEERYTAGHVTRRVRQERVEVCACESGILAFGAGLPFSLLELPFLPIDLLLILPYLIAGHRLETLGCGYVYDREPPQEFSEEWDFEDSEPEPSPAAIVIVRRGVDGDELSRIHCDVHGRGEFSERDVVSWSRGSSAPLLFVSAENPSVHAEFAPGEAFGGTVLAGPDWSVAETREQPDLVVSASVRNENIELRITNRGQGAAWQVAALPPDQGSLAGRALAVGRIPAGESRTVYLHAPARTGHLRFEFSEAFGHAPAPIDVDW